MPQCVSHATPAARPSTPPLPLTSSPSAPSGDCQTACVGVWPLPPAGSLWASPPQVPCGLSTSRQGLSSRGAVTNGFWSLLFSGSAIGAVCLTGVNFGAPASPPGKAGPSGRHDGLRGRAAVPLGRLAALALRCTRASTPSSVLWARNPRSILTSHPLSPPLTTKATDSRTHAKRAIWRST
jgi:hypothetical protein